MGFGEFLLVGQDSLFYLTKWAYYLTKNTFLDIIIYINIKKRRCIFLNLKKE